MTPIEIGLLAVLLAMFVTATRWPVNIGMLGLAASFLVGVFVFGMDDKEILAEFPAHILVTIVGVTFFFSLAQRNGTTDILVRWIVTIFRGKTFLVPWVFFFLATGLTALGTFSPATVAILAPAAMTFSAASGFRAVVMGAMIINGTAAGGFSPIAVAGVIVTDIAGTEGIAINPLGLFLSAFSIALLVTIVTVVVMRLAGQLYREPDPAEATAFEVELERLSWRQWLTLALMAVIVVSAVGFSLPIGFVGLTCGLVLAFTMLKDSANFVGGISWSTVLLVSGMTVYMSMLTRAGLIDTLAQGAVAIGAPLLVAMILCYVIGLGSAFASSTALLMAFIPLAIPLLQSSNMSATAVLGALAVSATIVDASPFSTDGALIIANARGRAKTTIWRDLLVYAGCVTLLAPVTAWALLVPTGIV